jgi:N-acetyl-gamma-glutamylphosphate reductase
VIPLDLATSHDSAVLELLRAHPGVTAVEAGDSLLKFTLEGRDRTISRGDSSAELYGLVEMIDNNPLVCADSFSLPGPAAMLASIALGPVIDAGLPKDRPILHFSFPVDSGEVIEALKRFGPDTQPRVLAPRPGQPEIGVEVLTELFRGEAPMATAVAVRVVVAIPANVSQADLVPVLEERFGRSLYVRQTPHGTSWHREDIDGKAFARYRVGVSHQSSLINNHALIEVISDPQGKVGAAGVVHAMNVMAGFEESLGLPV